MADKNGAWLNHTKKVRKKAIHPRWSIWFLPVKERILSLFLFGAAGLGDGDDDISGFLK